jgi:hypothetical protein
MARPPKYSPELRERAVRMVGAPCQNGGSPDRPLPRLNGLSRHESVGEEERDERVKPLDGIQLVQIQPGQRRSGQAGSEACTCAGRLAR